MWTYETICGEATRIISESDHKPYRHVIVDEAQDLSPWQWRLLRAAVPPGGNDLFLAGDTHQRIYDNRVSLRRLGIEVAGRSSRVRINYRTTAEILCRSLSLLHGERIDDMDDDLETLAGYRSEIHGPEPMLISTAVAQRELDELASTIRPRRRSWPNRSRRALQPLRRSSPRQAQNRRHPRRLTGQEAHRR